MSKHKCGNCKLSCCKRNSNKQSGASGDKQNSILFNFFDETVAKKNHVSTCKYTWYNFIFKFLIEQYQKPNNIFFLTVLLCNSIPGLAIVSFGTLLTPVIFILVISAIREIIEDIGRSKSDKLTNSKTYKLVRKGEVLSLPASQISQGDLVIIRDGDEVPADCLLMISSSQTKTAMVNTASLDGESNLKPRNIILTQFDPYSKESDLLAFLKTLWGRITVYPPNSNLTLFTGKVSYHWSPYGVVTQDTSVPGNFGTRLTIQSMAIGQSPITLLGGYSAIDKIPGDIQSIASPFSDVFASTHHPSNQFPSSSLQSTIIREVSNARAKHMISNDTINEDDDSILNDASIDNSPTISVKPIAGFIGSMDADLDLLTASSEHTEVTKDLTLSCGFGIDKCDPIFPRANSVSSKASRESITDQIDLAIVSKFPMSIQPRITSAAPNIQLQDKKNDGYPLTERLDLMSARFFKNIPNDPTRNPIDTHKLLHFNTDNTLLKGMKLQNTELAVGAVIYTAYDTRLMMNQTKPALKQSHVQKRLDRVLLLEILCLVIGVIICGSIASATNEAYRAQYPYAGLPDMGKFGTFFLRGMSYAVLFAYALPMSLFVSLELVRLFQGIFVEMDKKLRKTELLHRLSKNAQDPLPPAKVHCVVKASTLIEDLAEVDIIFSDKTGTLTSNEMIFHSFYTLFNGVQCVYDTVVAAGNPELCTISHSTLVLEAKEEEKNRVSELMTYALGLCNTIIVNTKGDALVYQGESPDEIAFAKAAAAFKFVITGREAEYVRYNYSFSLNEDSVSLQQVTVPVTYTFPVVIPFTSARKRMSIVLREEGMELPEQFISIIAPYLISGSPCPTPDPKDVVCFPHFSYSRSKRRVFFTPIQLCTVPGNPFLLSKGADSFLLPCCKPILGENPMNLPSIKAAIDNFSCEGLRTLVWAVRELSPSFLDDFIKTWRGVSIKPDNDPEYIDHTQRLERDLTFLAASAVEDRLADMVPETLATLLSAGIKVWMLTGDKTQTAVNISRSSNLAPSDSEWLYLTHEEVVLMEEKLKQGEAVAPPISEFLLDKLNKSPTKNKLLALLTLLHSFEKRVTPTVIKENRKLICCRSRRHRLEDAVGCTSHNVIDYNMDKKSSATQLGSDPSSTRKKFNKFGQHLKDVFSFAELYRRKKEYKTTVPFTTVIDSDVFKLIYMNNLHDFLLSVTMHSTAVICCRLSPEEKALIVSMTRNRDKYITTLAIGDGANDCPMIKSANIGIGIAGNEGLHASNSSDFSLPEFKYLRRLLFVHGHYTHLRNNELIEYCIYKNLILVFVSGLFSGQCLFTSQILFNDMMVTMYNIVLTFLPIFLYALTEHDIKDRVLEVHPRVYSVFEKKPETNIKSISLRILVALYHSLCMYFLTSISIGYTVTEMYGHNMDLTLFGYYLLNELIFIVTIKICLQTRHWSWATFIGLAFTVVVFIILLLLTNYTTLITETLLNTMSFASRTLHFWVTVFSVVVAALLPDIMYTFIRKFYFPNSYDLLYYQYRHLKRNCLGKPTDSARDIERVEKMDRCLEEVQARLRQSN